MNPYAGWRPQLSISSTVDLQQLLVLQPAERHRVLVVVLVGQVLNVWIPPDGRSGGTVDVSIGQNLTFKGAQHHGETPVEPQHPVQVECKHFKPVLGAFDQRAAPLLAVLSVSVGSLPGESLLGCGALSWWAHKRETEHLITFIIFGASINSQSKTWTLDRSSLNLLISSN